MLNSATQPLSLRDLVRQTAFLAFCGEAVCSFSFFCVPYNDIHHMGSSSVKWNVFTLQLRSISCRAPTPSCSLTLPDMVIRETWPAGQVNSSAVGTLIQLWLTRYHGNHCGQKFVLSPRTTQTIGIKHLTAKTLVRCVRFHLLCRAQTWVNFKDSWLIGTHFWWASHSKQAKLWHIAVAV